MEQSLFALYSVMPKSPKNRNNSSRRATAIAFMLLNTLLWGAALPIVKPALETTTPFRFLLYRFGLASVFSLPFLFAFLPKIKHKLSTLKTIIFIEVIQMIELALLYTGLSLTSSLETSLIATTSPLFTTIGGVLFLREKQERYEWLGLALAIVGTLILAVEPLLTGKSISATFSLTGNFLVFLQNISLAAYFLLAKKHYPRVPKLFASSISFFVGAGFFLLLSLFPFTATTHPPQLTDRLNPTISSSSPAETLSLDARQSLGTPNTPPTPSLSTPHIQSIASLLPSFNSNLWSQVTHDLTHPAVLLAVLYMAIFGSIIGLTAYIKGQDGMEASEASVFTYLQPLIYIPLATLWLKEPFSWPMLVAIGIIGMGVWMVEKK